MATIEAERVESAEQLVDDFSVMARDARWLETRSMEELEHWLDHYQGLILDSKTKALDTPRGVYSGKQIIRRHIKAIQNAMAKRGKRIAQS